MVAWACARARFHAPWKRNMRGKVVRPRMEYARKRKRGWLVSWLAAFWNNHVVLKKQRSARGCCRTRGNPWKGARGHRGVDSVAEYRSLIVARVYPWLKDSGTGSPLFRWLRHSAAPLGYPSGIYSSSSFVRSFALFTCSDSGHEKRPPFDRFATKLSPRKYSLNAFHSFFPTFPELFSRTPGATHFYLYDYCELSGRLGIMLLTLEGRGWPDSIPWTFRGRELFCHRFLLTFVI